DESQLAEDRTGRATQHRGNFFVGIAFPFPNCNGSQLAISVQAIEQVLDGLIGQHFQVRRRIRVGDLVNGGVNSWCASRTWRRQVLPSFARMAFLPFLFLHEFWLFTDGYSEEELPEVVAI